MNSKISAASVPQEEDTAPSDGPARGWLELDRAANDREPQDWSEQISGAPPSDSGLAGPGAWGARTGTLRLQPLRGQPLLDVRWGWLAGWIRDVALDLRVGRVAAVEVECAAQPRRWVAPFPVWRSRRTSQALEADVERWQPVDRARDWIGLDALAGLLVVEADGDWADQVADAEADPETWAIAAYLLRRCWWLWPRYPRLTPDRILRSSPDLLIVRCRNAGHSVAVDHPGSTYCSLQKALHSTGAMADTATEPSGLVAAEAGGGQADLEAEAGRASRCRRLAAP